MPAPAEVIVRPQQNMIAVNLEPVHNALYSLLLIVRVDQLSGLGEWVIKIRDTLTPTELATHRLVLEGLYYTLFPRRNWASFEAYLDRLETMDPVTLRDRLIDAYFEMPCKRDEPSPFQSIEQVLNNADDYVNFLTGRFGDEFIDPDLEKQAYTYVINPAAMQALIVSHLRMMWERFLETEWQRVQPMFADAVTAFSAISLSEMSI
jgi:hypothetical protein